MNVLPIASITNIVFFDTSFYHNISHKPYISLDIRYISPHLLFPLDGEFHYDVDEGDDISLHSFPQYPAHLQRFDSNTSLNAITRQSNITYLHFFDTFIFLLKKHQTQNSVINLIWLSATR